MADPCSFSSFNRCVTKHLNLNLRVDFDRHVIRGRVALTVEALQDRFSSLVSVWREANGRPAVENQGTQEGPTGSATDSALSVLPTSGSEA